MHRGTSGERDLNRLMADLQPVQRPGEFVFTCVEGDLPSGVMPAISVHEDEGLAIVIERSQADEHGLAYGSTWAWITLTVHSDLEAVGLTAEVSARLTSAGISCNVVAGRFHDHLFVPVDRASEALALLEAG
jgi:hypothetical protein